MRKKFELSGQDKVNVYPNTVTKKPKVSICITTYRHEEFIGNCIDSVLQQKTNFDFEILIGEDNSSDRTREICIEYAEKYPSKIRLFLHDRSNVISLNNRPTGRYNFVYNLTHTNGEYVAMLDGDDYWIDPLKLQKQVDFLDQHSDFSVCAHHTKDLGEAGEFKYKELRWDNKMSEFSVYSLIFGRLFHLSSIMFRQIEIPEGMIDPSIIAGDLPLSLLATNNKKIKILDDVMSVYRIHNGGVTRSVNNQDKAVLYKSNMQILELFNSVYNNDYNDAIELKKKILTTEFKKRTCLTRFQKSKLRVCEFLLYVKYFNRFLGYTYFVSLSLILNKMLYVKKANHSIV